MQSSLKQKNTLRKYNAKIHQKGMRVNREKKKNNFPNEFFPMKGFIGTDIKEISNF
jgi:hypothetical protein